MHNMVLAAWGRKEQEVSKVIFATGTTTDSLTHEILEVTHATVERIANPANDGVEIISRSGDKLFLSIDAARQLAFVLKDVCR
jgi:hypothetical protein